MATAANLEVNAFGADKVARYNWTQIDKQGQFMLLEKARLQIDTSYQRLHVSEAKIKDIASQWSWIALGAIAVGKRNGEYWVIDGQHRTLASYRRSDITHLPCMIFDTTEVAEEAQGFLNANDKRRPVSAAAKHRAGVVAGDLLAIKIQALLDHFGLTVQDAAHTPNSIKCIAVVRERAKEDFDALRDILELCVGLARAENTYVTKQLLEGLFYLNRWIEGGFRDNQKLRKRVREIGIRRLLDGATRAAGYFGKGGAKIHATGMLEVINKGLHRRFEMAGTA
jgi:hypothetical protein